MVTNGQTTRFAYDAFGRRVRKEGPSGTTQYVHQGDHVALELDGQQNVTAEYTWFPGVDRPHSVIRNGSTYYYARGPTNSVTGLFDTSGSPVNQYRYGPWGETESAVEGVGNPYRYTGRRFDDETGLYHNRARYYDPDLARFISQDPLGLGAGINPYAYAGNDPVNARDPSGLLVGTECETAVLVTFVKESGDIVDVIELGTSCPSRGGSGGSSGGGSAGSGSPGAPKLPEPDTLPCPSSMALPEGPITSDFQDHLARTPPSNVPGVDIDLDRGDSLFAPHAGVVLANYNSSAGGNVIRIEQGRFVTSFRHMMTRSPRSTGDSVGLGDFVGLVGETGNATGPHLHADLQTIGGDSIDIMQCAGG